MMFKFSGLKYYLHARNFGANENYDEWEVSAHYLPVTWRFHRYFSYYCRPEAVRYGIPIKIG